MAQVHCRSLALVPCILAKKLGLERFIEGTHAKDHIYIRSYILVTRAKTWGIPETTFCRTLVIPVGCSNTQWVALGPNVQFHNRRFMEFVFAAHVVVSGIFSGRVAKSTASSSE